MLLSCGTDCQSAADWQPATCGAERSSRSRSPPWSYCGTPAYETSPGQLEAVVGEGMPKVLEITYAGKRRSCVALLAFRAERSEEHTSELQSLRHLVCRL